MVNYIEPQLTQISENMWHNKVYILVFWRCLFFLFFLFPVIQLVSNDDDCQNDDLSHDAKERPKRRQAI